MLFYILHLSKCSVYTITMYKIWPHCTGAQQAESERIMQQCYFLMQQALDADEADLKDLALQLYTQAVELAVSVVSTCI